MRSSVRWGAGHERGKPSYRRRGAGVRGTGGALIARYPGASHSAGEGSHGLSRTCRHRVRARDALAVIDLDTQPATDRRAGRGIGADARGDDAVSATGAGLVMYWRGVRGGSFELFGRVYSPVPATFMHERDVTCVVLDWGRRLMPPAVIRSASRSLDMIEVRFGRTEPSDSREMLLDLLAQTRGRIRRMARGSAITSSDHIAVSGPLATPPARIRYGISRPPAADTDRRVRLHLLPIMT
jgi:hypothetical protein